MKRVFSIVLGGAALLSVAWVAVPIFLIYPFRAQTPARVALSYALRERSATLTLMLLVVGVVAAFLLWRRLGTWLGRAVAVVAMVALCGAVYVGRWNHFESMFHPLPNPEFATPDGVKEVADEDLVLGVRIADEAKAYPVREMAYHHLVNDVIGSEPIVATY